MILDSGLLFGATLYSVGK